MGFLRMWDRTAQAEIPASQSVSRFRLRGDEATLVCERSEDEFISVFLCCLGDDTAAEDPDGVDKPPVAVRAQFCFSFIDQTELRAKFNRDCKICDFYPGDDNSHGGYRFMRRNVLERSRHRKADSFVIRCDILVVEDQEEQNDMLTAVDKEEFTFEVGGMKIPAHRGVLAPRSTVFKQLLSAGNVLEAKDAVVKIDDTPPDVFDALIAFI
ncbi:BTB/POZ and MATH domain-containing protein 2-like [Brachypodium distachyon]|uniref:BTB/POZ and MATH domain-containing protein 2-like n=1 Tax=Brachypodium distachyon TaxID=15368 RepID=UPI00052FF1CD|nr:BTB/POZ and MATH domain-containing protein 2-like [Brachypodium distachyon]|eukprot:XP_010236245.1 BTB/POZ and MATH domain-containing protein 2-like [Brachypodium distachyon]